MSKLQDAADRIRAGGFGEDLDLLESRVEKTLDNFKALAARIATLEAALEPFAEFAEKDTRDHLDSYPIARGGSYDGKTLVKITMGDCVKARAALTPPQEPQPCPDCVEAKKLAYSDATTPGFFKPYCPKHAPQKEPIDG